MEEKDRLQKLIDWVRTRKRRSVKIEIGGPDNQYELSIWAYNYDFKNGEHIDINNIDDIEKIDLEGEAEEAERQEYERLKTKYENNESAAQA